MLEIYTTRPHLHLHLHLRHLRGQCGGVVANDNPWKLAEGIAKPAALLLLLLLLLSVMNADSTVPGGGVICSSFSRRTRRHRLFLRCTSDVPSRSIMPLELGSLTKTKPPASRASWRGRLGLAIFALTAMVIWKKGEKKVKVEINGRHNSIP